MRRKPSSLAAAAFYRLSQSIGRECLWFTRRGLRHGFVRVEKIPPNVNNGAKNHKYLKKMFTDLLPAIYTPEEMQRIFPP